MVSRPLTKNCFLSILIIPIIMIILSATISFADADRIFKENNKAVVVIETYDKDGKPISQGSGFVVRADGAIVTNYHVISNATDIKVKSGEKILEVEGLLHIDKENDIVILKAKVENLQTVKIGDIEKLNVGEKVYVISSPQGLENTISDGILSGIREITPQRRILQITAPVSKGSSGGAVFNKNGEVIGIATFLIKEAQNLNFAMPVSLIKDKISARKVIALKDAEIENYTKTADYWFFLGYHLAEAGLYKEAIEAYKQALKIKPDFAPAHSGLGFAYGNLGMHKEAIEAYKQVIRIVPDFATTYYSLGVDYDALDMYREAIDAYKQAIKTKPNFAVAYLNLGTVYTKLGMYKEATEVFKQTIKIKPDLAEAYINLGVVYGELGMYKEAIEAYKQAIRIKPDLADAHYNLGLAYNKLGMYKEALESFKQTIRIKPDFAEAHYYLSLAYGSFDMYREAMETCKQAIRIKPDYAEAHFWLGVTYLRINDRGSALEEYKILKELDSELANQLFNLIYK